MTTGDRLVEISSAPDGSTALVHLATTYKARVQVYSSDLENANESDEVTFMESDMSIDILDARSQTTTITNLTPSLEANFCQ